MYGNGQQQNDNKNTNLDWCDSHTIENNRTRYFRIEYNRTENSQSVYNIVGVDLKRVTEWLKVGK